MPKRIPVFAEAGQKRVFVSGVEWPGWSRSGKTEEEALAALVASAPRYDRALGRKVTGFTPPNDPSELEVVERLSGGSGTDFGVPSLGPKDDDRPVSDAELDRLVSVLEAAWAAFDRAVRLGTGKTLRKGPRGGGREVPKIVEHVFEAEKAYVGEIGGERPRPADDDRDMGAVRRQAVERLRAVVGGAPMPERRTKRAPWTPRYFVRRSAWHALDHAWEIEDRIED
jgi:hypothetical protein